MLIAVFILFVLLHVCLLGCVVISFLFRKRFGGKIVAAAWVGVAAILLLEGAYVVRWRRRLHNGPPSLMFTSSQENWRSITIESDRLSAPQVIHSGAKDSGHPPDRNTITIHMMVVSPMKEGDYRFSIEFNDFSTVWAQFSYPGTSRGYRMDIAFERRKPNEVAFTEEVNGKTVFQGSVDPAQTRDDSPYRLGGAAQR